MKEYGSNIQKLVEHLQTIEDREKRTRYAHILVELMRQIHPNMRDNQDYYNKLWDDLNIMSGFRLDVDSPYPPPTDDVLGKKPQPVPYNTHGLRYKHYGQNINLLIAKAISLEDADERLAFVSYMARLMKTFYSTWNKEAVEDETILQNLDDMANGKLHADIESIRTNGFVDATPRERTGDQPPRRNPVVSRIAGTRDQFHRTVGMKGPIRRIVGMKRPVIARITTSTPIRDHAARATAEPAVAITAVIMATGTTVSGVVIIQTTAKDANIKGNYE